MQDLSYCRPVVKEFISTFTLGSFRDSLFSCSIVFSIQRYVADITRHDPDITWWQRQFFHHRMNESYGVTMQKGNSEKPVQCCSVFTLFSLELIKAGDPDQTWRPHSSHLENASLGLSTCHCFCFTSFSGIGFQVPLVLNRQLGTWYYFCRRIGRGDPAPAWTIRQGLVANEALNFHWQFIAANSDSLGQWL